MRYTIEKHERYVVIEPLCTLLDGEVATFLKEEFMLRNTSGLRNIVLDLSQVNEITEEGLRMGLLAHRLCQAVGGVFILSGLTSGVEQVLKLVQLNTHFIIVRDLSEAEDVLFENEIKRDLRGNK
jgi:anti-sigma B factor antagonist